MSTSSEYDFAGHDERVRQHYDHAREKHPYFCDWVQPSGKTPEEIRKKIEFQLSAIRAAIVGEAKSGTLGWDDLLNCEVWEVFEALANDNKAHAIEELYDCIAVCLRTIDVLEGRQKLGKHETISGNGAGKTRKVKQNNEVHQSESC